MVMGKEDGLDRGRINLSLCQPGDGLFRRQADINQNGGLAIRDVGAVSLAATR